MNYKKLFNIIYQQIIGQENIFPIKNEHFLKSLDNIIIFNDDIIKEDNKKQQYMVQLPEQLYQITINSFNSTIDKNKLNLIFPQLESISIPKIYPALIDLNNSNDRNNFLEDILQKLDKKTSLKFNLALWMRPSGCLIDMRPSYNILFLIFNKSKYSRRTIYRQWTHILQKIFGKEYQYILKYNIQDKKQKNKKLQKFNLDINSVENYYLTEKQYITHIDNLIYAIKETHKLKQYNNLSKFQFLHFFIENFQSDNPNILKSQLANNMIILDSNFIGDIRFFISMYILFPNTCYFELIHILQNKFC